MKIRFCLLMLLILAIPDQGLAVDGDPVLVPGSREITIVGILQGFSASGETKTADYILTENDYSIRLNTSLNDVTAILPTAIGIKDQIYCIKLIDDTNIGDIDPFGTQEIDGDSDNFVLYLHDTICIQSDNVNWWIL